MPAKDLVPTMTYLPPWLREKLRQEADAEERSVSWIIRRILEEREKKG